MFIHVLRVSLYVMYATELNVWCIEVQSFKKKKTRHLFFKFICPTETSADGHAREYFISRARGAFIKGSTIVGRIRVSVVRRCAIRTRCSLFAVDGDENAAIAGHDTFRAVPVIVSPTGLFVGFVDDTRAQTIHSIKTHYRYYYFGSSGGPTRRTEKTCYAGTVEKRKIVFVHDRPGPFGERRDRTFFAADGSMSMIYVRTT